ncbi:MAG: sulfatase-like hydrolase/transferase [Planctomycetota bacterium]
MSDIGLDDGMLGTRLAIVMAFVLVSVCDGMASEERPNVIVILTDDQGSVDAGCYGASDIETPAIDGLAARGIRFTQFYAAAPVCSPSRAGLLTGRYPVRAGVPGNVSSQPGAQGMPSAQETIAEVFRASGYVTAHIGKWHLGYSAETRPEAQGFLHSFGHMGGCIDNYSHFFYWNGPNRHDLWRNGQEVFADGQFFQDLMLQEARRFLSEHREDPFFVYFALNSPHYPYQGRASFLEKYANVPYPRNLYAAFLSTADETVGRLVGLVRELGLEEDTIIVFQSDHGHSVEVRAHRGGGSAGSFRGAKFSLFEGGIRVPAIISWPGHLAEGESRNQVGHGCDWLPTLAELCDISLTGKDLDGLSLAPVLRDASANSPHEVIHWQGAGKSAQWAIRSGDWKLIGNPSDPVHPDSLGDADRLFLANIARDPSERKNLAAEEPDRVAELKALHQRWVESWR